MSDKDESKKGYERDDAEKAEKHDDEEDKDYKNEEKEGHQSDAGYIKDDAEKAEKEDDEEDGDYARARQEKFEKFDELDTRYASRKDHMDLVARMDALEARLGAINTTPEKAEQYTVSLDDDLPQ